MTSVNELNQKTRAENNILTDKEMTSGDSYYTDTDIWKLQQQTKRIEKEIRMILTLMSVWIVLLVFLILII